jgi:hypothetical protein
LQRQTSDKPVPGGYGLRIEAAFIKTKFYWTGTGFRGKNNTISTLSCMLKTLQEEKYRQEEKVHYFHDFCTDIITL